MKLRDRVAALPFALLCVAAFGARSAPLAPHGTVVSPMSRVYRVYQSNPWNPNFALAANAVAIDGSLSYYTWNELSRNIPQAVLAGLPPGFDYSPWIPDGELASAGRTDPNSTVYPRTYAGLDQVSPDWPTTPVTAGQTLPISFLATAPHSPSVWDVWMTTPDWDPSTPLRWSHMEFLGRPTVTATPTHYNFDVAIPTDRAGHHVLWIAWQRHDPAGEAFFSTSDLMIAPANDECGGATQVSLGRHPGELQGSTPSAAIASCENGNDGDVWYRITAPCNGNLHADVCGNAPAGATVSIWSGTCASPTELACSGCGPQTASALTSVGSDYLVKVSAPAGPNTGFELNLYYQNHTGSFTPTTTACAGATLVASGAPNLGGHVQYEVQNASGLVQAIVIGFAPAAAPACPGCTLGTSIDAMVGAPFAMPIPCDPALVGTQWWTQGLDAIGAPGGCSLGTVDFTLTETVRTVLGS